MRVHIVEPYHSHAMSRMSAPLVKLERLYEVTTGEAPDNSADVNIHMPWHSIIEHKGGKNIIAYTHCNPPDRDYLLMACEKADMVTCMSFTGRRELVELGVDPKKIWVVYSAADNFKYAKKLIGIVGTVQPNGRKNENLLVDMAWKYQLAPFEFGFIGFGWDETVKRLNSLGVSAWCAPMDDENLQKAYQQMDALLVTGRVEGGPLPVLEAMAVGVPIISPKFGYAADLCDLHYENHADLATILTNMATPSVINHQVVKAWTWDDYAAEYALLIGRLLGNTTELFPERGTDRYAQLLELIDEHKPERILEIGTWNGNRAIQMIQAAAKYRPIETIRYQGFDLFDDQTGEQYRRELSKQACPLDVVEKRLKATGAYGELIKGDTRVTLSQNAEPADLYFIDGGHSEQTIESDWMSIPLVSGVVVFDDYYHEGKPEGMGCNKLIDSLGDGYAVEHLSKQTRAEDGRLIGMVKVKRA